MIWELFIKSFIPVSKIFGNEDDIEKNKKNKIRTYYEKSTIYKCGER